MASTARLDELKKKFDENPRRYFAPLANEHRKSGDLDQAISLCRAHLPQQPAHISGHIVLGQALFEAAQLDESRGIFQSALELDPENLIALRYLGDIARHSGDIDTARSWYRRVLEFDPRNDEIVLLVRELDAPAADAPIATAVASPDAGEPPAEDAAASRVESEPASDLATAARFAPLSMEELDVEALDVDEDFLAAPASSSGSPDAVQAHAPGGDEATFDVHAAWDAESPTVELPLLDSPELDPFDMPASASADSLFDAHSDAAASDLFLSELAVGEDLDDTSELATASEPESDTWQPAPPADAAAEPPADAVPTVEASAAVSDEASVAADADAFEEGSFYAEAPTSEEGEPGVVVSSTESMELSDEETIAAHDVPAPEDSAEEPAQAAYLVEQVGEEVRDADIDASWPAAVDEGALPSDAIDLEDATPMHAADWAPAPAAELPVDDGFGLEVMEFVPPARSTDVSRETSASVETDPLVGHMPELSSTEQGATPAAFVTETMAELYLQQGFRSEALSVYRELLARNPEDTSLRERIDQIESGSMSSISIATLSENVVESAMRRQTARPTRSVRSFFASLAGRRAPYQPPRDDASPEATLVSSVEDESTVAPSMMSEPDPAAPSTSASTPAADVMASFDPFADNWNAPGSPNGEPAESHGPSRDDLAHPDVAPAAEQASAPVIDEAPAPEAGPPATPPAESPAGSPAETHRSAARSLQDLFPETSATPRADAAAAQTLATAFGGHEPQGRPTRAASNELSLDHVFRGAPESAPVPDGGFSFDQFFSDSRSSGSDVAAAPAVSTPENGRSSEGGDSHDIEQFTAWLEGLKKK